MGRSTRRGRVLAGGGAAWRTGHVGYLRRKLSRPCLAPLIQTVRGAGYRLLAP